MEESTIGIHAMWNEHFGSGIVECMVAGLIMVAHKSGGPMVDIVTGSDGAQPVGFLASDESEYAKIICRIIRMSADERERIREAARNHVTRFSDDAFQREFINIVSPLMDNFTIE